MYISWSFAGPVHLCSFQRSFGFKMSFEQYSMHMSIYKLDLGRWTKSLLPSVNCESNFYPALFRFIFFVLSLLQWLEFGMLPEWKSCATQFSLTVELKDAKKRRKHLKKWGLMNGIFHFGNLCTHLRLLFIWLLNQRFQFGQMQKHLEKHR